MKSAALAALTVALGCSALASCAQDDDAGFTVATASYPLAWTVRQVAGPEVNVVDVVKPGVEPHDAELTVRQTADLTDADLVVYETGLSPAVDEVADGLADDQRLEVSDAARRLDDDPHFWLDPTRLASVAGAVGDALGQADPAHADAYRKRARTLQEELATLDDEFEKGLESCRIDTVVVSHEAFDYLGARYGLDIQAVNGLTPDAEPSPHHLVELRDLAEREGITTVFAERLGSPELADTLADELGLRVAVLDPIEGLSSGTADENYLSLMRENLAALRKANECT
jgi:zinc transport system substrate-binding protein